MSLGFMFPGQGSQTVGMLTDVAELHPDIAEHFQRASDAIDQPLWDIVRNGPEQKLNSTAITQPAILVASVALWNTWLGAGGSRPQMLAGHSLGEYSALVCAGSLSLEDGARLVHERGKLMQQAVPEGVGAMAAVLGLDDDQVRQCCEAATGVVAAANFNAPGQVVIAGAAAAVDDAAERCRQTGARRAVLLPVSGPFHCELMKPAQQAFAAVLEGVELTMPEIAVVHNVDARVAENVQDLREKLVAQIAQPVLWTRCAQAMISAGVERLVECGPGKVLSGLLRRIDRSIATDALGSLDGLSAALNP
ncbi:MAG: ACP S-malonyltransferase [Gammaproteobacteria bacterium]|nr:ACP S-malonyltransferase [Gammaproteobacteria bacterium]